MQASGAAAEDALQGEHGQAKACSESINYEFTPTFRMVRLIDILDGYTPAAIMVDSDARARKHALIRNVLNAKGFRQYFQKDGRNILVDEGILPFIHLALQEEGNKWCIKDQTYAPKTGLQAEKKGLPATQEPPVTTKPYPSGEISDLIPPTVTPLTDRMNHDKASGRTISQKTKPYDGISYSFRQIIEGYISPDVPRGEEYDKKLKKLNNSLIPLLRDMAAKEQTNKDSEDKRKLMVKEPCVQSIHDELGKKGFIWCGGEKEYGPKAGSAASIARGEQGIQAKKGAQQALSDGDPASQAPASEGDLSAAVEKAIQEGSIKLGAAIYRMLPEKYEHHPEVQNFRRILENYAKAELVGEGIVKMVMGIVPMVAPDKVNDFYEKILNRFQPEIKGLRTSILHGEEQFDLRYTPNKVEAIFKAIYDAISNSKNGTCSENKIRQNLDKRIGGTSGFNHLPLLIKLAKRMHNESFYHLAETVNGDEAMNLFKRHNPGIDDLKALKHISGTSQCDEYSKGEVIKAAIMCNFKMDHPYVFYDSPFKHAAPKN